MNWDVWGAPIAVLAIGVVVGLVVALRSTGQGRRDPKAELVAKKDALVDQLRSLRADRAKLSDEEFERRWSVLLDDAARALRDVEQWTEPVESAVTTTGTPQGGRWARRAAWAVVVTVFFAGLGVTLQTASHERQEGATMTGGDLVSGSPLSKTIAELEAKVAADGQDIDALNQLSYIAINAGDLGAAMGWLDKARAVAPEHPEVRTHMAILQASVGMGARAKTELDSVLAEAPTLSKALLWKGLIALQSGEREVAVTALESALDRANAVGVPSTSPMLRKARALLALLMPDSSSLPPPPPPPPPSSPPLDGQMGAIFGEGYVMPDDDAALPDIDLPSV